MIRLFAGIELPDHIKDQLYALRGGVPNAYDRVLSTRLGAEAAMCIKRGEFGVMMARTKQKITAVPLADIAGKLKTVDPKSEIIRAAKLTGISFGD